MILVEGKIVLANYEAVKMYGQTIEELIGKSASELVTPEYKSILEERMRLLLNKTNKKSQHDHKIINYYGKQSDVQVSSGLLIYEGKPGLQCVIRDIIEYKKSLNKAAEIQRQSLIQNFPLELRADMETIYYPAKTVSGDFYCLNKLEMRLL